MFRIVLKCKCFSFNFPKHLRCVNICGNLLLIVIIKLRSVGPRGQERSQSKRKSHRKVTKLVLTVITVYIICWLPHWVTQIALIK